MAAHAIACSALHQSLHESRHRWTQSSRNLWNKEVLNGNKYTTKQTLVLPLTQAAPQACSHKLAEGHTL